MIKRLFMKQTQTFRGRRAGVLAFSLVEVMVAASIMAIIFAALFAGISSTFSLMDVTRENLRATQIMVSRLEGLRLCAWSNNQLFNTSVVPTNFTDSFYPLGLNSSTNPGTSYAGTLTITTNFVMNPAATYNNNLAQVTISVAWTSSHGTVTNVHHRSMTTYVAQYGMQNYIYAH
jgi:type II secretory pathway pseudopilin PulG